MKKQTSNYAFYAISCSVATLQASIILLSLLFVLLLFSSLPVHATTPTSPPQHYVIVLDNSGSMKKDGASQRAQNLIMQFQNRLKPNDKLTVISFGTTPRIILQKIITSHNKDRRVLDKKLLTFREMFTDLHGGFSFLLDFLEKHKNEPDQTFVLLLTDGLLDLVSKKNAQFPKSITKVEDYKELLSRYAPYIRKNSIKRDKIAAFNKELNRIGVNTFTRDIIPKMKNRTTPLFVLTFADKSPLLLEISSQIALKEGMKNYFIIRGDKDGRTFLDTFFSYVVRLEKMKESGQFAEVRNNYPTIQTAPPIQPPKHLTDSPKKTDYWQAIIWISVFLGITAFVLLNIRQFLKRSSTKVSSNKSVPEVTPQKTAIVEPIATAAEEPFEVAKSAIIEPPAGKKSGRSKKTGKKELIEPQPLPVTNPVESQENDTADDRLVKESQELKNELLMMDENKLLERLKHLGDFQRNALAETDEYMNSLLQKLHNELKTNIDTKLAITENRHDFRHIIPEEYPLYFVFSAQEFNLQGKVLDISQGGVGLATSSTEECTPLDDGVNGNLNLILDNETVAVMPAHVAYFDTVKDRLGISSLGLKRDPDLKLLWLETFTNILNDLKRQKNDNT